MKTKNLLARPLAWGRFLLVLCVGLLGFHPALYAQYPAGSPVAINGRLKLVGNQLSNECGNPVQLRGMSSHGPQWFQNCYTTSSLDALANDWKVDVFRLAMYVQEGGYVNDPNRWKAWIDNMVAECGKRGIYCLIDWHTLNPGDPSANLTEARDFWNYMSTKHKGDKHVLYEICNEPNGVSWDRVKTYAQDIIPRIRANDPSTIIIVGTPTWSQDVDVAANSPLTGSNLMYTLHFYSGTHTQWLRDKANAALSKGLALFVTEFGTSEASGNGGPYLDETQRWIDWMASKKISWVNWSFADKDEVSAALKPGSCGSNWNNTSVSGAFIKQRIISPADNFVCSNGNGGGGTTPPPPPTGGQSPYAGVIGLPGTVEAENFDKGGEGVAYHDSDATNLGGEYRPGEGVDLQTCTEGGYNVGWTAAGEWLEYSVNVASAGPYQVGARVASPNAGRLHYELDGQPLGTAVALPATGGYQTWQTVTSTVTLPAGAHVLRVAVEAGGVNLNRFTFSATGAGLVAGQLYRLTARHSGQVLDLSKCSPADGAKVQQYRWLDNACQRWRLEATDGGYYKLRSQSSGLVLEVNAAGVQDGDRVQQWSDNSGDWQQWKPEATDGGYYKLTNRRSGRVLEVGGISQAPEAGVQQWNYLAGANQQWLLDPVGPAPAAARLALATTTARTASEAPSLQLAPNPASEFVDLTWTGFREASIMLSVVNMKGQLVRQQVVHGAAYRLSTAELSQGLYLVKLQTGSNATTQKLLVQ